MRKDITISAAFDKRHPEPAKNYGIHGCEMRFIYGDERGYVQFLLYTNWHLPEVEEDAILKGDSSIARHFYPFMMWQAPMAADLGYHAPAPQYEGQEGRDCDLLGTTCYYDGSSLNAERIWTVLRREGSEGVWRELEEYWMDLFAPKEETSAP
jgi:hypothetical protein